jgi:hypothetical protein
MITRRHPATFPALALLGGALIFALLALFAIGLSHAGPASELHDPLTSAPLDTWGDLARAKASGGWALALVAALVMLLRTATRIPGGIGAWLGTGRRATLIGGGAAVAVAAYDVLATGGSLAAVLIAVVSAALAAMHPSAPAPSPTRTDVGAAIGVLALMIGAMSLPSCATLRRSAAVGVSTVLDCTTPDLRGIASDGWDVARAALPGYIDGSGHVDTATLAAQWKTLKSDAGKCFLSGGIAALLSLVDGPRAGAPMSAAITVDPGELRRAFAAAAGGLTVRVGKEVL